MCVIVQMDTVNNLEFTVKIIHGFTSTVNKQEILSIVYNTQHVRTREAC